MRKHISGVVIGLILIIILSSVFRIQPVRAAGEPVYIRADGLVDPSDAPILNVGNVSYTFTDDINESLVVERDNIVVDGAGYMLLGAGIENGISLSGRSNVTVQNLTIEAFEYGIYLSNSPGNTLYANTIINNTYGIRLDSSSGNSVSANNVTNSTYAGIQISSSLNNGVSANNVTNNGYGILLEYSSNNNNITGNTITNNKDYGIKLYSHSDNNGISANNIANNTGFGILLYSSSSNNNVSANYIANNTIYGIKLWSASGNSISENNVTNNSNHGIWLYDSSGNSISANNIANGTQGIWFESSSNNNSISANNITNNKDYGILLDSSSNNIISANNVTSTLHGISLEHYSNNNGISANYVENTTYFGIRLLSSSGNSVSANNVTNNNNYGILLEDSSSNSVSANRITDNSCGIYLTTYSDSNSISANYIGNNTDGIVIYYYSNSNGISANTVTNNSRGIWIYEYSSSNSVYANNVTNNSDYGIWIYYTSSNNIYANNVTNNGCGIMLEYSSSNSIFHNNFESNTAQATVNPPEYVNTWDKGYPSGGNIWSDYAGVDLYKGPYQNETGSDGIGDTPYVINANNTDRYPLVGEWSPVLTLESVTAWYWTNNTVVNSVAVADVDGDGQKETVTGGSFYDGSRNVAQLVVWNSSSLAPERLTTWYWTDNTTINSVAIGDVDGDGGVEIVTGGYYFDGTRQVAQLVVWNGSSLAVEGIRTWYWINNTVINSVALGDVDGDAQVEIVTGGYFNDDTRNVAQLVVWNGTDLSVDRLTTWCWIGNTVINSVAVGDVDADGQTEIVTGGTFNDDTRDVAQLVVWTGSGLAVDRLTTWYWTSNTVINSVAVSDVDADGQTEIVTGGYFNDGTLNVAQLVVWTGSALAVDRLTTWYWTDNTVINSVALGDMDGDGEVEVVTGGYYNDGVRNVAQMVAWSGDALAVENIQTWYWVSDTVISSVCLSDVNGDFSAEIVTGGAYNDGTRWIAQVTVWGME